MGKSSFSRVVLFLLFLGGWRVALANGSGLSAQVWRVDPTPVLSIDGNADGLGSPLFRVVDAFRLSSGRVVAANASARELRVYDERGSYLFSIGRHGGGPGELSELRWARRIRGDSILVWDATSSRISLFAPDGEFVARTLVAPTVPSEWLVSGRNYSGLSLPIGALRDGRLVARPGFATAMLTSGPVRVRQDTIPLVVHSRDGEPEIRLGPFAGAERFAGNGNSMDLPFGRRLVVGVGADRIAVGTGKPYEIGIHALDGSPIGGSRGPAPPRRVTDDDVARYEEHLLSRFAPPTRPQVRRELDATPFPDSMPAFDLLMWDRSGNLWARRFVPAYERERTPPVEWDVFDGQGGFLTTVTLPVRFDPKEIGTDYLVGVYLDDFDVEWVRVYRLVKG